MNGLAALLALALAQGVERPPPGAVPDVGPAAAEAPPAAARPALEPAPAGTPAAGERPPAAEPARVQKPVVEPPPEPAAAPRPSEAPPAAPRKPPAPQPRLPAVASAPGPSPAPERGQVAAAAVKFFEALLARRAAELAALCAPDFSFDGTAARGAEDVRSRWSEAVASHDGLVYVLYDLEVLPAAEAAARFGKPPRRVAGLLQPGSWVAVANLSGRPTFVFFARQGPGWVATGLHD